VNMLHEHLLSLLVFLPLIAAGVAMTFPNDAHGGVRGFAFSAMGMTLGVAITALMQFDGTTAALQLNESMPWIPMWGASYAVGVDGLAMAMVVLTCIMAPISLCTAGTTPKGRTRDYVVCLLLLQSMILGAFVAIDLLLFYVFWEAMLVPAYFLIGIFGGHNRVAAAQRFFLYTMAGSMVMLAALVYVGLSGTTPSFLWPDMVQKINSVPVSYTELALFLAFALAFAIKIPLVPLHGWLPNAYAEAPVSVTIMLSAVMVKVGAFGFLRYALMLFPRAATYMMPTLATLAVVGILYGAWVAYAQDGLRRILAYASVSHMGFIVLGMCSMAPDAMVGSGLQMINHAVSTGGLFILTGLVLKRQNTDVLAHLGGLAKRAPTLAAAFVWMALSSMGLPGLNGFVGEFLILLGTFGSDGLSLSVSLGAMVQTTVIVFIILGLVLGGLAIVHLHKAHRNQKSAGGVVALGTAAIILGVSALVLPPVGPLPCGLLLRPLLPHALSTMPYTALMPTLAVLGTLGVVLGAVYLLVAIERTFFGTVTPTQAASSQRVDLTSSERWLLVPFVVASLGLGLYPAPVLRLLEPTMRHYAQTFRSQAGWPTAPVPGATLAKPFVVPVGPGHLPSPKGPT
jgi:NADH-quinone oxidoreductase subunit M